MSHSHKSEHLHSTPHIAASNPWRFRHLVRLFILNAILYGACAAFIGAIIGDSLPTDQQPKVVIAFIGVPLVLAVISSLVHAKTRRWTNVDDMAERLLHPHQTPHK